jgi:hypothetical protein
MSKPLLHFFALGGVFYLCSILYAQGFVALQLPGVDAPAVLSKSEEEPEPRLNEMDDELLFREALALGLHHSDEMVRLRLLKDLRFLDLGAQEYSTLSKEQQLSIAYELELYQHDVVVRRRLVQLVKFALFDGLENKAVAEDDLFAYYQKHSDRWLQSPTYSFKQVFFAKGLHGEAGIAKAWSLLQRGEQEEQLHGDFFQLGYEFVDLSEKRMKRDFGESFVQQLQNKPLQQWLAPIESVYGTHLVYLQQFSPGVPAAFSDVKNQIAEKIMAERRAALLALKLEQLRDKYRVHKWAVNWLPSRNEQF